MRIGWVVAAVLLSGCVLHAPAPLFTEADAVPLFGSQNQKFAIYEMKDGAWVAEADPMLRAVSAGHHYPVADPSETNRNLVDSYAFIPLDGKRFIVQAETGGEPGADNAIATWDGTELLVSPLACETLESSRKAKSLVSFDNGDCAPKGGAMPRLQMFAKLAVVAGPPLFRFVRQ